MIEAVPERENMPRLEPSDLGPAPILWATDLEAQRMFAHALHFGAEEPREQRRIEGEANSRSRTLKRLPAFSLDPSLCPRPGCPGSAQ